MTGVTKPIIGTNFLHHNSLLVNIKHKKVSTKKLPLPHYIIQPQHEFSLYVISKNSVYHNLLQEFTLICKMSPIPKEVKHSVIHCIKTRGKPIRGKICRLLLQMLEVARAKFQYTVERSRDIAPMEQSIANGSKENQRYLGDNAKAIAAYTRL